MSPTASRPVPRPFLERVSRPLLARLLGPHAPLLERHGLPVEALARTAQTDRAQVEALWHLLASCPSELVPLREDLLTIADVATAAGHEILLARDAEKKLDSELGAEDCAVLARLDHPSLFETVRPQSAGQSQTRSFASYRSAAPAPLVDDPDRGATFERRMGEELVARGRSSYFCRHDSRSGAERHMELVYGRLAATRDLIGKVSTGTHDLTAQVTDRSTERAHAVFHDDTMRLDVAGQEWMKELVRSVFGEVYFGTAEHFRGGESITLSPLEDLASALSIEGVTGLKAVHLLEVWLELGGPRGAWVGVGARTDCLNSAAAAHALRALADGVPVEAAFHLYLLGRARPVKLVIAVAKGRMEYDRRDPLVARAVRDWVIARGYMSVPRAAHVAANDPVVWGDAEGL
ncbi:MAG TPA: hypothetical protein VGI39_07375 [Polyangiaceae bacterium]|jgi:hypothetical protein